MTTLGKPAGVSTDIPTNLCTRSDAWNKFNLDMKPRIHLNKGVTGDASTGITTDGQTGNFTFGSKGRVMNLNGLALTGKFTASGTTPALTGIKAQRLINTLEYTVNTDSIRTITNAWNIPEFERHFKGEQYIAGNETTYQRSTTGTSAEFIIPLGIYWDLFLEDMQFVPAGNLGINFTFRDPAKCCGFTGDDTIITVSNLKLNVVDFNLNTTTAKMMSNQISSDGDTRIIRATTVHKKNMINGQVTSTINQAATSLDRIGYYYMANDEYDSEPIEFSIDSIDFQIGETELFTGGIKTALQANTVTLEACNQMSNPFVHMSTSWCSAMQDNACLAGLFQIALEPDTGNTTTGYNTAYSNIEMPFNLETGMSTLQGTFIILTETSQFLRTTGSGSDFNTVLTK